MSSLNNSHCVSHSRSPAGSQKHGSLKYAEYTLQNFAFARQTDKVTFVEFVTRISNSSCGKFKRKLLNSVSSVFG